MFNWQNIKEYKTSNFINRIPQTEDMQFQKKHWIYLLIKLSIRNIFSTRISKIFLYKIFLPVYIHIQWQSCCGQIPLFHLPLVCPDLQCHNKRICPLLRNEYVHQKDICLLLQLCYPIKHVFWVMFIVILCNVLCHSFNLSLLFMVEHPGRVNQARWVWDWKSMSLKIIISSFIYLSIH